MSCCPLKDPSVPPFAMALTFTLQWLFSDKLKVFVHENRPLFERYYSIVSSPLCYFFFLNDGSNGSFPVWWEQSSWLLSKCTLLAVLLIKTHYSWHELEIFHYPAGCRSQGSWWLTKASLVSDTVTSLHLQCHSYLCHSIYVHKPLHSHLPFIPVALKSLPHNTRSSCWQVETIFPWRLLSLSLAFRK